VDYTLNTYLYKRRPTHEVMVGNVGIGRNNPIRVQSMTNVNTMDTEATVAQTRALVEAGCEIVRITAPSVREAQNLGVIRERLRVEGLNVPLVADIHFTPNAAIEAANHVDKVRVNPGNYAERGGKSGAIYSDTEYQVELERIEEKFRPLVIACREMGRAMRIGTNHGSLSERIVNRYGDTPQGMVESAMEFVYFAEAQNFRQIVLSMKASNPQVMIHAYRLLASRLLAEERTYPLHLGVTEAGGGVDGRVKSASGIFSLLADGLGDTIRVSLTEDPVAEIPVAKNIVMLTSAYASSSTMTALRGQHAALAEIKEERNPYIWNKPARVKPYLPFTDEAYLVAAKLPGGAQESIALQNSLAQLSEDQQPDLLWTDGLDLQQKQAPFALGLDLTNGGPFEPGYQAYRFFPDQEKQVEGDAKARFEVVWPGLQEGEGAKASLTSFASKVLSMQEKYSSLQVGFGPDLHIGLLRLASSILLRAGIKVPLILHFRSHKSDDLSLIEASGMIGSLLLDGIGDGVYLDFPEAPALAVEAAFKILQAARLRITETEYISCPSCGRTLFDLEETTARIRSKTAHLKGLKIGVMGCIVNGPGEMADADFGYVGAGKGKVNLYVGHELVKKNIPTAEADSELIALIKAHGRWQEVAEA
jgi:(E)-4-hydroxy-3-methylbut-2-enyl-diphosphate synthase